MIITDKGYNGFKYYTVWKITAWKDDCVFKTKELGFIKVMDQRFNNPELYIKGSLSTSLTKNKTFTIKLID